MINNQFDKKISNIQVKANIRALKLNNKALYGLKQSANLDPHQFLVSGDTVRGRFLGLCREVVKFGQYLTKEKPLAHREKVTMKGSTTKNCSYYHGGLPGVICPLI